MPHLPGPSLRGSVRRTPDDHSDIDSQAPPMKRQRTQLEHRPRRRRSSPDCLATTHEIPSIAAKVRPANPPLKAARPRTSTRRARRQSSSSVDTIASAHQFRTPGHPHVNGNGSIGTPRGPSDRENPSILDRLRDARESPDPLDTISPIAGASAPKTHPRRSSLIVEAEKGPQKSPTTRPPRRRDTISKTELASLAADEDQTLQLGQPVLRSPAGVEKSLHPPNQSIEGQSSAPSGGSERRSLRSADSASRCKSELAQYFYNYEQIISLEATKPVETLAGNTTIILLGDLSEPLPFPSKPDPTPFGNPLVKLYDCESIDLPVPESHSLGVDPLGDELYFKAHRKFERQEKQLRNIERDRAQHEKQALDRLLEELQSPEWLRVMGLVGVHESEKKLYEPKRQILIQELVALVNKFQAWKDEEKRRRLVKEKPPTTADLEQDARRSRKRSRPTEEAESSPVPGTETPSTPDPSDVDAWAARQLHQEARSASGAKPAKPTLTTQKAKAKPAPAPSPAEKTAKDQKPPAKHQRTLDSFLSRASDPPPAPPPAPTKEPVIRFPEDDLQWEGPPILEEIDQTETELPFGHPIPEFTEKEFEPPSDFLTEDAIKASRRLRRLLKRRSHG